MAQDKSTYLRNAVLDAVFNAGTVNVTTPHVSLHTADPGLTGANEVTGGSYARLAGSFEAAAGGATQNDTQLQWTDMPGTTVAYVGVWDATTAGNFLYRAAISGGSKTVNAGDTFQIAVGDLDFTEL